MNPERGTTAQCEGCQGTITWVLADGNQGTWIHDAAPMNIDGHEPRPAVVIAAVQKVAAEMREAYKLTSAVNPWSEKQARLEVAALRTLLTIHTATTRYLENGPVTTCEHCTPPDTADDAIQSWLSGNDSALDAGRALWPCRPLTDAGLTLQMVGVFLTGVDLGKEGLREELASLNKWKTIVNDLDRCPHGRHEGDTCAGWRGPGRYDGGCRGGVSLGNPAMETGQIIGTALSGQHFYAQPARKDRHRPEAWKFTLAAGVRIFEPAYQEPAPDDELTQTRDALRAANQTLFANGHGPFLPGVGQLPRLTLGDPEEASS